MTTAKKPTAPAPAPADTPANTPENHEIVHILQVNALGRNRENKVNLVLAPADLAHLAAELGLSALRKVSLRGGLFPQGKRDWQLKAVLGATFVQPCIVTLAPVTTRIDEPVERLWRAEGSDAHTSGSEDEMPEDTNEEALTTEIDLGRVLAEALALALPAYPRAQGAALDQAVFSAPGIKPMHDEDARPFAGLAALQSKLSETPDDSPDDSPDDNNENEG